MFANSSYDINSKIAVAFLKKDKDGINPVLTIPSNFLPPQKPFEGFLFWMGFSFSVLFLVSFHLQETKSNLYLLFRINQIPALTPTVNRRGRSSWGIYPLINPPINCYGIIDNRNTNVRCEINEGKIASALKSCIA